MEYFILVNNQKQGPYSIEDLKAKDIDATTMIWRVGCTDWTSADKLDDLKELLISLPPQTPASKPIILPKTWLVESILVTVLCCIPFGIVGIINATKVESCYINKQYDLAQQHSDNAKKWTLWGFFSSIVIFVIYIIIVSVVTII